MIANVGRLLNVSTEVFLTLRFGAGAYSFWHGRRAEVARGFSRLSVVVVGSCFSPALERVALWFQTVRIRLRSHVWEQIRSVYCRASCLAVTSNQQAFPVWLCTT
ncbi:expressed protein [Echinococcus multilocularis]|uniref:Expressed protein n=1 Tax=Echinococcus multilocularis TaxID=6211 RepID=A0A068Y2S6_ECHMU|nr:expressed protein [Echinococcus multilocularis]